MHAGVHDANAEKENDAGDGECRCPEFDTELLLVLEGLRVHDAVHLHT